MDDESVILDEMPEIQDVGIDSIFTRFLVNVFTQREMDGKIIPIRVFNGCIFNENNIVLYNTANDIMLQYRGLDKFAYEIHPSQGYHTTFLDKNLQLWDGVSG